jgi:hypothetical protein
MKQQQQQRQVPSIYAMVNQVLSESTTKLASEPSSGYDKTASARPTHPQSTATASEEQHLKIAAACDVLADRLHDVIDDRSAEEKLAEYHAVREAIAKQAFSVGGSAPTEPSQPSNAGDNSKGPHQTQTANPDSVSPANVGTDSSGTGVGGGNAIPSSQATTPGVSLDAGQSGEATKVHQSPMTVQPTEKPNPMDAANAVETNRGMMMPDQPEDVLKQSMAVSPTFQALRARQHVKQAEAILVKAASAGIPVNVALATIHQNFGPHIAKMAEDALNPAKVSGGTKPILQSEPGVPSQLSQGAEAGSNTPRETAPTSGAGGGRELLSSVEAAINATKGQAKRQNKGSLSEVLTEPSMSKAHDKTLHESLDNTSAAGVKISSAPAEAARELLRMFQDSSPENGKKLAALHKLAQNPDMAAGGGAPPDMGGAASPMPDDEAFAEEAEGGVEGPSPEAMEAAAAGVTPEEVAQAEELLAAQGALAQEEAAQEVPGAGAPEGEPAADVGKTSQGMGAGMGGMSTGPAF